VAPIEKVGGTDWKNAASVSTKSSPLALRESRNWWVAPIEKVGGTNWKNAG
jgi:hypothetical protein